jgi:hypothetical protein
VHPRIVYSGEDHLVDADRIAELPIRREAVTLCPNEN